MAFDKKVFDTPMYMKDVGYLKKKIKSSLNILDKYDDDSSIMALDDNEILSILECSERASVSIRAAMEELCWSEIDDDENITDPAYKNMPVSVNYNNGVLQVRSVLTFDRNYKDSHYLGSCLKAGLELYKAEHGDDSFWHKLDVPYYVMNVRYTPADKRTKFRDSDHTEEANIINIIASEFGVSDEPANMGYISATFPLNNLSKERVDIYVFSYKRLLDAASWLRTMDNLYNKNKK